MRLSVTKHCLQAVLVCLWAWPALCQVTLSVPLIQNPVQGSDWNPGYGTGSGFIVLNILSGTAPFTCSLTSGSLPAGLSLSTVTPVSWPLGGCLLSGTPSVNGDFTFTLQVMDNNSNTASQSITLPVMTSSLPAISAQTCSATSPTAGTCTWTTNVSASSYVCYGTEAPLPKGNGPGGGTGPAGGCTAETDTSGVTSHSVSISGLESSNGSQNGNYYAWACSRGISGGVPKDYLLVCVDVGAGSKAFTTQAAAAAGTADFGIVLHGPHNVTNNNCGALSQGCAFYVLISDWPTVGTTDIGTHSLIFQVQNPPTNSKVHWPDYQDFGQIGPTVSTTTTTDDTLTFGSNGLSILQQFEILLNVGGTTPNGSYTLTLKVTSGATPTIHSYTYAITVNTNSVTLGSPASQPAIPSLATWKNYLTTIGNNFWLTLGQGASGGNNVCPFFGTGLGFYDGQWVMYQTGMYLGTSYPWWYAGRACATRYQDYAITGAGVWGEQSIYVFSDGNYYNCMIYGSPTACNGVNQEAQSGPGSSMVANLASFASGDFARESSFMLRAKRLDYDLCQIRSGNCGASPTTLAQVQAMVNYVLGNMEQYASGDATILQEHFMAGLMMMSVIECYEDTRTCNSDPRIPVAVQKLADYMWNNWWLPWDGNKGCLPYEERTWQTGSTINTGCLNSAPLEDLNGLIAPAFAWLYYRTGIQKYQQEADTLFNSSVLEPTGSGIGFFGKTYSQDYWYAFKFLGWRGALSSAAPLGCFMLPQTGTCPTVTAPVPAAGSPTL